MKQTQSNVAIVLNNADEESIDRATYIKWLKMTRQFSDEPESELLTPKEYCRYIENIIQE